MPGTHSKIDDIGIESDGQATEVYTTSGGIPADAASPDATKLKVIAHLDQQLNQFKSKHVTLVQQTAALPWYKWLWLRFPDALLGIALSLLVLAWIGMRRFGPLLPEPSTERRSLLEHVDASGRWLWRVPGGRELLLGAARRSTLALLRRQHGRLERLSEHEQTVLLARVCALPEDLVHNALHEPAAAKPAAFTRQIQTLTQLRQQHER